VVAEWEKAVSVPSGLRKRRLIELFDGKCWKSLRATVVVSEDIPPRWQQAIRWYRRASRVLKNRRAVGEVILSALEEARRVASIDELRQHYRERTVGGQPILRHHCQPA